MNLNMLGLIKIEFKKHKMKKYLLGQLLASIMCIFLSLFLSLIGKFDPSAYDLNSLSLILSLNSIFVGMVSSFTLASMFSNFIISSYSGRQIYKTLGYPINRKKLFMAKILSCIFFIVTTSIILIFLSDSFIYFLNSIFNIVFNDFHKNFILYELKNLSITISGVLAIGIISLYLGWIKKSIVTTMISVTILYSFIGNQIQIESVLIRLLSVSLLLIISIFCIINLLSSLKKIEL